MANRDSPTALVRCGEVYCAALALPSARHWRFVVALQALVFGARLRVEFAHDALIGCGERIVVFEQRGDFLAQDLDVPIELGADFFCGFGEDGFHGLTSFSLISSHCNVCRFDPSSIMVMLLLPTVPILRWWRRMRRAPVVRRF